MVKSYLSAIDYIAKEYNYERMQSMMPRMNSDKIDMVRFVYGVDRKSVEADVALRASERFKLDSK